MGVSVYQIVTDRIIAELEKGIIPWERPWTGVRDGAFSRATGKPYSLLNQLLLGKPGEYRNIAVGDLERLLRAELDITAEEMDTFSSILGDSQRIRKNLIKRRRMET